MKKILFVATVPEHFYFFHTPCFEMLKANGWEVHAASCGNAELAGCDKQFVIPIDRMPTNPSNREAYRQLKKIIDENGYDIVHCHTPVGGALARLAARDARKKGTRVFYTAHGFHFYSGAPKANWLIYYPTEYILSSMTDELITINKEDYERAKHMKAKHVSFVHGVGCRTEGLGRADTREKHGLREKYGYRDDEKILLYVAELNRNKNQSLLIDAAERLRKDYPSVRLLLVGPDSIDDEYRKTAEGRNVNVDFLGLRGDVPSLLKICDVYVASSLREGLPVNVMEAMASGLPVVAVDNRGHRSLVTDGETGFLVKADAGELAERVKMILDDSALYEKFSGNAVKKVKPFELENVLRELAGLYKTKERG